MIPVNPPCGQGMAQGAVWRCQSADAEAAPRQAPAARDLRASGGGCRASHPPPAPPVLHELPAPTHPLTHHVASAAAQ